MNKVEINGTEIRTMPDSVEVNINGKGEPSFKVKIYWDSEAGTAKHDKIIAKSKAMMKDLQAAFK